MNLPLRRYVIVIQQPVCVSLALALPCILFLGCAVRIIHLRLSEFLRDTQNSATLTSQAPNTKNLEDEDSQPQAISVSNVVPQTLGYPWGPKHLTEMSIHKHRQTSNSCQNVKLCRFDTPSPPILHARLGQFATLSARH